MLKTEQRNPNTTHIDQMTSLEMVRIFNEENYNAVRAVEAESEHIAEAIDLISERMAKGGRLLYIGAGTSGRLGVLDASECPPTFGVPHETVTGIIAGGYSCLVRPGENNEDKAENAERDLKEHGIASADTLVGISAAGGAAYIVAALEYAKALGCGTVAITSNEGSPITKVADISIATDTGAEIITGSTRLKAGTAQKLVLNMLSTCAMIHTGKVYENLMINLAPSNIKLRQRMINIVSSILECDAERAENLLDKYDWKIRAAVDGEK